jgi:alpha-L-fucosidase
MKYGMVKVFYSAIFILTFTQSFTKAGQEEFYNTVKIDAWDTEKEIIYKAAHVVPTERQVGWQEVEFEAFIHFGVNTFTDREWGDGKEDPGIFNPVEFDSEQWVEAFKSAGMRGVVLTAKHHDGFCLWPSRYTEHSVKNSPWREGKGDIVKELSGACRKVGLKFGVYLSPWDRHETTYGDSPKYNEYFRNQLTELLTNYGSIHEVWFDGACGEGPNGRRQVYDWDSFYEVVRRLQPGAAISIVGPDARWCGNEAGHTRESEWSVVPTDYNYADDDIGSREKILKAKELKWYPAQVNTSIRPGWFYHASQDNQVKSLEHLLDVYYGSVGGNGQFLLNLPPDKRGLIHENDVERLTELGRVIRETFDENLVQGCSVKASAVRGADGEYSAKNIVDGDKDTFWMTEEGVEKASVGFDLGQEKSFNCVMIQEYIKNGQRVEEFSLEVWDGGKWVEVVRSTVIGHKRLLRFDEVKARRVRLNIIKSRVSPTICEFGLYRGPVF